MNCRKCKKEIPDESVFCCFCGSKQETTPHTKKRRGNGEGTVFKRGQTWTARAILGWWVDDSGIAHRHERTKGGFKTKKEALDYLPTLRTEGIVTNRDITLQELYKDWSAIHYERVGESTAKGYMSAFNHFKPIWGFPFREITIKQLQACVDDGSKGRRTKEMMKALMGCLYKHADKLRVTDRDESVHIDVGTDKKGTHPAFTMKQVERIRQAAADGDIRAVYTYCMIYLGFRPGEMLALKRDAYHNEEGVEYFIGGGKTEAGTDRIVPISVKIKPFVYELILKADPYIFSSRKGNKLDDKNFRDRYFYPLLADLGIQEVPTADRPATLVPYSCRHTFANLLKNAEGAGKDKAALIGHTDYSFTESRYQSAELENLLKIVDKF
jgi:integrase